MASRRMQTALLLTFSITEVAPEQGGSMATKTDYEWRKAHGLCVHCGTERVKDGRVLCSRCQLNNNDRQTIYYERRSAAGLCVRCSKPTDGTGSYCPTCKEAARQRTEKRRARLKATGICRHCGKRPVWEGEMCGICRERLREYEHIRRCERRAA